MVTAKAPLKVLIQVAQVRLRSQMSSLRSLTTIRQIKTEGNVRQVNDIEEKGTCDNQAILKREA